MDPRSPSGAKWAGKRAATGSRDMALVRAFSGAPCKVCEGQPWPGFFRLPGAGVRGPSLREHILLLSSQRAIASAEQASFIVVGWCRHVGRERLQQQLLPLLVAQQ